MATKPANKKTPTVVDIPAVPKTAYIKRNKKLLIVFAIVCLLILVVSLATSYVIIKKNNDKQKARNTEVIFTGWNPTEFWQMTPAQIKEKINQDTKEDADILLQKPVDKTVYPNFEKAYTVAEGMYWLKNYSKSLEIYKLATSYDSTAKTYMFYLNYAGAAQTMNDMVIASEQLINAKKAINESKDMTDNEKKSKIEKIDQQLRHAESGVNK